MGVAPTDDSPKYVWDSASGSGSAISSTARAIIDVGKAFLPSADAAATIEQLGADRVPDEPR